MGKRIAIGSASVYKVAYDPTAALPSLAEICVEANRFSHIKNGATFDYTPTKVTEEDDLGLVKKTVVSKEDVKIKLGLMTFDKDTIVNLIPTARTATSTETGKNLVKIGGKLNDDETSYVWCIHHHDEKDPDIWIVVVGKHNGGVPIELKNDAATVINAEIEAEPMDNDGTKAYYYEESIS